MKKRNFLWSVLAVMMAAMVSVGFASCDSDDDEDDVVVTGINVKDLVGTWSLAHSEGWETWLGQKETYSDDYDPENPTSDDATKMVITNPSGNTFEIVQYDWDEWEKDWVKGYSTTATLDADHLTVANMTILSVNATQLVVEMSGNTFYSKQTYKRMK